MSTKRIVYLEDDKSWLFDGHVLTPCDFSYVKKYQSGAFISLSKIQVGNYKFSSSLSDTEIEIQTEIKMYENAGLSSEKDYEITSYTHNIEFENTTLVEAFACSHEDIKDGFDKIAQKSKNIDWLVPSFISYESFYTCKTVTDTTDLFYYLSDEEAHIVLFQNRQYVAHRRVSSIKQLAKESGLDIVRCKGLLNEFGLLQENYPEEEKIFFDQLESLFSKQVEKIVHTINHKRGLFGISGIDNIYIDFGGRNLEGIERIFSVYGMENIHLEVLSCKDEELENAHRYLKAMYIYLCANDKILNPLNLTIYERQPPIYKRHVGVLMGVSVAAMFLALIYPGYYYIQNQVLEDEINSLEKKHLGLKTKQTVLNKNLNKLKEQRKEVEKKITSVQNMNKVYNETLNTLPELINTRYVRRKMMYDALSILESNKLSTISLEQNGTTEMNLHVICNYTKRDNIAKFIKKWIDIGYSGARTSEIYLDENIYESKIRVLK